MMPAILIPDSDYSFIHAAARQLHPTLRPFAARVHALLQELTCEPGPGDVDRAVRLALRKISDPPPRNGAQDRVWFRPRVVR